MLVLEYSVWRRSQRTPEDCLDYNSFDIFKNMLRVFILELNLTMPEEKEEVKGLKPLLDHFSFALASKLSCRH
jgi:hypothetical protein